MVRVSALCMSFVVAFLFVSLPTTGFASDGVYMEQEIKVTRGSDVLEEELTKTWMLGDLIKIVSSKRPNYTIIDSNRSVMWVVDDANKVYMSFPVRSEPVEARQGGERTFSQRVEPTGRTKKIGRWDCFEVKLITEVGGEGAVRLPVRTFVWLTKSAELIEQGIRDSLARSVEKWVSGDALKADGLDGLPVQVVVEREISSVGKKVVEQTVVTVRTIAVVEMTKDMFEVPAGYRELEKP